MKFTPENYRIPDVPMQPFIDADEIQGYLDNTVSTPERVREIIAKSLSKKRLNLEETAVLINTSDPALVTEIKEGARELKKRIYGNRIVLFAPLYTRIDYIKSFIATSVRTTVFTAVFALRIKQPSV